MDTKPRVDTSKTAVYLKVFLQVDEVRSTQANGPAAHVKCEGSNEKIIGIMISHLGAVYGMLSMFKTYRIH